MKLTHDIRKQIVTAIMADIPYRTTVSDAEDYLLELAENALPEQVRKLWKNSETKQYVSTYYFYYMTVSANLPGIYRNSGDHADLFGEEAWKKFTDMAEAITAEKEERKQTVVDLTVNFASIRTAKVFGERFPELAKYLPVKAEPVANLPATTNLMDKLKAMGLEA